MTASRRHQGGGRAVAPLRAQGGFTMAELLAVIAILAIVAGLVFVSLANTMRNMQQVELDGTAREIFIAAQNHLSTADSHGLLDTKPDKGTRVADADLADGEADAKGNLYYYAVDGATDARLGSTPQARSSVLYQMLPPGSIDETVRSGGTYVIKYDVQTATVLAVFYAPKNPTTMFSSYTGGFTFGTGDYSLLFPACAGGGDSAAAARRAFANSAGQTAMIGYYGGERRASAESARLKRPTLQVFNDERLVAVVGNPLYDPTDPDYDSAANTASKPTLQLVVTGVTSGNTKVVPLISAGVTSSALDCVEAKGYAGSRYFVYLDDIAPRPGSGDGVWKGHFADLFGADSALPGTGALIPGEDITIQAKLFSTANLANIAQSAKVTRNSLFGSLSQAGSSGTVSVSKVRHLENLSKAVSGFDPADTSAWGADAGPMRAVQLADLSWIRFCNAIDTPFSGQASSDGISASVLSGNAAAVRVLERGASLASATTGPYVPVDAPDGLAYDGGSHRISDVVVDAASGDAGVFGACTAGSIANLEIVNPSIRTQGGNAGALAGSLDGTSAGNVLARNEVEADANGALAVSGTGDVGGLVGSLSAGSLSQSAAAVRVRATGTGAAGGLVGKADDAAVSRSYSGGHTVGGAYAAEANVTSSPDTGVAGGLVGSLSGSVVDCYSTCSVSAYTAGGLAGAVSGGAKVSASEGGAYRCYATGAVNGAVAGALVGSNAGSASGAYLEIVNSGTRAVGADQGASDCAPADASPSSYQALAGASPSVPYDVANIASYGNEAVGEVNLVRAYQGTYPFKTVAELLGASGDALEALPTHLKVHYGDWPATETLVQNIRVQ